MWFWWVALGRQNSLSHTQRKPQKQDAFMYIPTIYSENPGKLTMISLFFNHHQCRSIYVLSHHHDGKPPSLRNRHLYLCQRIRNV